MTGVRRVEQGERSRVFMDIGAKLWCEVKGSLKELMEIGLASETVVRERI